MIFFLFLFYAKLGFKRFSSSSSSSALGVLPIIFLIFSRFSHWRWDFFLFLFLYLFLFFLLFFLYISFSSFPLSFSFNFLFSFILQGILCHDEVACPSVCPDLKELIKSMFTKMKDWWFHLQAVFSPRSDWFHHSFRGLFVTPSVAQSKISHLI